MVSKNEKDNYDVITRIKLNAIIFDFDLPPGRHRKRLVLYRIQIIFFN